MTVSLSASGLNLGFESAVQTPRPVERTRGAAHIEADKVDKVDKSAAAATSAQTSSALDEVNKSLQMASIGVRFEFDKETHTMVTKVVDVETGEMIRQMPNEEAVHISKVLSQLQGLLVSQKV